MVSPRVTGVVYFRKMARAHGSEFEKLREELMGRLHEEGKASAQRQVLGGGETLRARGGLECS